MRFLFLFILSIFQLNPIFAQEKQFILKEDFLDNNFKWVEYNQGGELFKVSDGKYSMQTPENIGWKSVHVNCFLSEHQDWELELEGVQNKKGGNSNWGIFFNMVNGRADNFVLLSVAPQLGKVCVMERLNSQWVNHLSWTENSKVKNESKPNNLKIRNERGIIRFVINDEIIFESYRLQIRGNGVGIYVNENTKLEIDKFYISKTIHTIPNAQKTLVKVRLNEKINSPQDDLVPVISPNGKELYYTSAYHPKNVNGGTHDIRKATKDEKGNWKEGIWEDSPLNDQHSNTVWSVGSGGNRLLLNNTFFRNGQSGVGLSVSEKTTSGWSFPENLNIQNYYNLAQDNTSSACWSQDERLILFSIQQYNAIAGSKDLYICKKIGPNIYTQPIHMGNVINTPGVEASPFLAPDNKSLYFASNGHAGYGGFDIFVSKRLDDTWVHWSEPLNLGPAINSTKDDMYFSIAADGKNAYISSTNESIGLMDIFEIKLQKEMKPDAVTLVKGYVKDQNTQNPLEATITVSELKTNKKISELHANPKTGYYEIILQKGIEYAFYAEKDNYFSIREILTTDSLQTEYKEITKNLFLASLNKGDKLQLNNLFFERGKAVLLANSKPELDHLIDILQTNKELEIRIEGHTDAQGDHNLNQKLSEDRARNIYLYLIDHGISSKRLQYVGYGGSKPIASNNSEAERSKNRRVELEVIKN